MSTLLITMLGGSGPEEDRAGHRTDRFRLPGGERIVETQHLGVELARALGARKLVFVGTTAGFFDRLGDLLPPEAANAPVENSIATGTEKEPLDTHLESEVGDEDFIHPEATAHPSASESGESILDSRAPAPSNLPVGTAALDPTSKPEAATALLTAEPVAEAPSPTETAPGTGVEPASEVASATESGTVAAPQAGASEAAPQADAGEAAPPTEVPMATSAPSAPHRVHEPDPRPLADRLAVQARTGRPDRAALNALSHRLARTLNLDEVRCVITSDPSAPRSALAALRTLVEIPAAGDTVHIDVSFGPRSFPVVGFLAMHYLREFRNEVHCGSVFMAAPEGKDAQGITPVVNLDGQVEIMKWMNAFQALVQGQAPGSLHVAFNRDRRLQKLAGPYVRFQRGARFGALSEVIEGAKLLEEGRRRLGHLPYSHPYKLFDPVLRRTIAPYVGDGSMGRRQVLLAREALQNGILPLAALHLRDALISLCLEAYGRNPTQSWIEVPQSGGAQEVRPREVAAYILSTEAAQRRAPDLATVWPLLFEARHRYLNTSPTMVSASQLKDEDHEIHRVLEMTLAFIEKHQLHGLAEALPFDDAIKQAVDLRAVRPREGGPPPGRGGRRNRGRDRRRGGHWQAEEAFSAPEGSSGGPQGEGGHPHHAPRHDRPPRRGPPDDRGPRGDRPRGRDRGPQGGDRGPRPFHERGPREAAPPGEPRRDFTPRPDPADSTPRVSVSRGGELGTVGLALAQAGLVSQPRRQERPPPEQSAPGKPKESAPPPSPGPATEAPPASAIAPAPPPPAPEPQPPASEARTFDVAGPGAPPA